MAFTEYLKINGELHHQRTAKSKFKERRAVIWHLQNI